MKKLFYLIIIVSLASCVEEAGPLGPSGTIRLNLNAKFAGNPLVMDQPYLFGSANQVKFDEFNLFISNVSLLEAETEDETDLLDVALADFSDNLSPSTVEPEVFTFKVVPAVKYRGIKIGIGVPSSQNKASSGNYGAGHPLKQAFDSHFYADDNSYFFMKLAGVYDLNGDGIFDLAPDDNPFELFPLKNSNYKTITLIKSFELKSGETLDLNLDLDVLKLLQDANNQVIDFTIPANLSTYNPENDDLSSLLMGNFETALEIQ
jgi:hypothetical protein